MAEQISNTKTPNDVFLSNFKSKTHLIECFLFIKKR